MALNVQNSVALYSSLPGMGKTTVADILREKHGFKRVQFSAPLRAPLYDIGLGTDRIEGGLKDDPFTLAEIARLKDLGFWIDEWALLKLVAEGVWPSNPETKGPEAIQTPRQFMKARALVLGDEELVRQAAEAVDEARAKGVPVVVDDLRWPAQYDAVCQWPRFEVWRIIGPQRGRDTSAGAAGADPRFEGLLDDKIFDQTIDNSGSVKDLEGKLRRLLTQ